MKSTSASRREGPVLVVDDDAGVRTLLRETLERARFRVVEAGDGGKAMELARARRPSLVVLDVVFPHGSGFETCRELREDFGEDLPIVFLSGRSDPIDRTAGILLGADDYISKPFNPDELLARVRRLLDRRLEARPLPAGARAAGLTPRELEVLRLLARGLPQREIARSLVISPKTVATHIQRVLEKLDVHSRAEAVAVAHRERLTA